MSVSFTHISPFRHDAGLTGKEVVERLLDFRLVVVVRIAVEQICATRN